jgi:hypothetical protein
MGEMRQDIQLLLTYLLKIFVKDKGDRKEILPEALDLLIHA